MDDDEEHRRYGDPTMLEPIAEQQDDEMTTSAISSSSVDTGFLDDERRAREEIEKFEELEKECASNRRRVRVKFAYSLDDDQVLPITQTTVIKTEPCFQVNASEDQVTKHFYENEFHTKNQLDEERDNIRFVKQMSSRTPSEPDSLEEEYIHTFKKEKNTSPKTAEGQKEIYGKINDQTASNTPGKSILKKSQKKEKTSTEKLDRSSASRSPSPSSSKKKQTSLNCLDSNEVQHLAEATAKQTFSQPTTPPRSLFEPTINIFDTSSSRSTTSNIRRPSRLRYYIKPYRGEANNPLDLNNQRSRSLSEQRIAQQSAPTVWYTFTNQYNIPSSRKQHVSWSPVREYIHQGRDKKIKTPTKKKELPSSKASPFLSTRSTSNPCLQSSASMIPVSLRYRSSRSSQVPQHFRQSFPPSSLDSYETASAIDRSLTPITPMSQYSQYEDKKEMIFTSPLPDIVHLPKKEHDNTMQRYDRLLEKMRATDEQLQTLSRTWVNNPHQKTSIKSNRGSNLSLNKTISNNQFFSPMILQMCLIILVIFNLLVLYFFNEINIWWSRYIAHSVIVEQHDEQTSKF